MDFRHTNRPGGFAGLKAEMEQGAMEGVPRTEGVGDMGAPAMAKRTMPHLRTEAAQDMAAHDQPTASRALVHASLHL